MIKKITCLTILVALICTGALFQKALAQTMMPIPAFSTTYTGSVRGYWFTAPTNFTITGLRVVPGAGTGLQYIHVFKINDPTPVVYATSSTNFNTLAYISGATNAVIQAVNIPVNAGDKIGILGSAGTVVAYSASFAATAQYSTNINGMPVTLSRLIYQGNINTGAAPNYSTELSGNLGLIEMYYTVVTTPCTAPPAAGNATSNVTSNLCPGDPFSLNLSGNSVGVGQTYQWQTSTSNTGPWTNVGTSATFPFYATSATATAYYRCEVTCGTSTAYSSAVLVPIASYFPAGTYTINSAQATSGTNFHSFGDAVNAIKCGIAGPVVFNVVPGSGPYNEQVIIPNIGNTSAVNTVTFNGNNQVLYDTVDGTASYAVLCLNGADYVKIKKLKVQPANSGSYATGIILTNDANNNLIDSCEVTIPQTSTSSYYAGILISGLPTYLTSGSYCDSNTISNNKITGGYYGIGMYGNTSASKIERTLILNNKVEDFYYYGIMCYYNNHLTISGNDVSRPSRSTVSTVFYGIYSYYGGDGLLMTKNRIHTPFGVNPGTSGSVYALYPYYTGATMGEPAEVSNNLIYDMRCAGTLYGIRKYDYYTSYVNVYNNTINLNDSANTGSGTVYSYYYYQYSTGATNFSNNLIAAKRGGSATIYGIYSGSAGMTGNRNDYFVTSTGTGTAYTGYSGGAQSTLANWQAASGMDTNAKNLNPYFDPAFATDFYPTNDTLNDMCLPIAGITTDILNAVRNPSTPDVGAFEFSRKCDGPGYPGIALTSDTGMCPGYKFTLTDTSYQKDVSWLTRLWQYSNNNGSTWYAMANGVNRDTLQLTFPNSTMYYRLRMICQNTGDTSYSNVVKVTLKPPYKCYCYSIAEGGASDSSDITAFSINGFATNTGGPHIMNPVATRGRTDYTDYGPIVLYRDSSYEVNIYHTLKSLTHADALVTMFIDYNNNLVYDYSTNESVDFTGSGDMITSDPNGWYLINKFTVPHAVITNVPTGLRLILNNDVNGSNIPSSTACGGYTSGETEDYVVIIKEHFPTGINNIAGLQDFVVYPNPNNGQFTVSFNARQSLNDVQVTVTDITGRVIRSVSYGSTAGRFNHSISLSGEAKGVYLVTLKADNQRIVEKVTVQ